MKKALENNIVIPLFGDDAEDMRHKTSIGVRSTLTEELVVVLCGPIGSPLKEVSEDIKTILTNEYGYSCKAIKLSIRDVVS